MSIPDTIFIIPYRDRIEHKTFFVNYMTTFVLKNSKNYEIFFAEQQSGREFNRGGMKNIGFLACKEKYPNNYKNITFIFNDIDVVPYTENIFDYETKIGEIKHFYGFEYTLGGSFAIKGGDFERINGFPNIWSYGMEDNMIYKRAISNGIVVNRSNFHLIHNKKVLHFFDGSTRNIEKGDRLNVIRAHIPDGLNKITNLRYTITSEANNIQTINVSNFEGLRDYNSIQFETKIRGTLDLPIPPSQVKNKAVSSFMSSIMR